MPADYLRGGGHGRGNTRSASLEVADGGVRIEKYREILELVKKYKHIN